ncbi:hypothetical protein GCM10027289_08210 [Tsukamurella serpentis]
MATISELERGRRTPTLDTALAIATALDVSSHTLIPSQFDPIHEKTRHSTTIEDKVLIATSRVALKISYIKLCNKQVLHIPERPTSAGQVVLVTGGNIEITSGAKCSLCAGESLIIGPEFNHYLAAPSGFAEAILVSLESVV